MNQITINGRTISVSGSNIVVTNNTVIVDGKVVSEGLSGIVRIEWAGPLASLDCGASVNVAGDVQGTVDAGGSVTCRSVGGDVDAGGSVNCGAVAGKVRAGGSVVHR